MPKKAFSAYSQHSTSLLWTPSFRNKTWPTKPSAWRNKRLKGQSKAQALAILRHFNSQLDDRSQVPPLLSGPRWSRPTARVDKRSSPCLPAISLAALDPFIDRPHRFVQRLITHCRFRISVPQRTISMECHMALDLLSQRRQPRRCQLEINAASIWA